VGSRVIPVTCAALVASSWAVAIVSYETHGGGASIVGYALYVPLAVVLTALAGVLMVRGRTDNTSAIAAIACSLLAAAVILYLALAFGLQD
jgi:hypothetical protein